MAGTYKDIPPNIKKCIEALYGISLEEWTIIATIINNSFDEKRKETERGLKITSEKDIVNKLFLRFPT